MVCSTPRANTHISEVGRAYVRFHFVAVGYVARFWHRRQALTWTLFCADDRQGDASYAGGDGAGICRKARHGLRRGDTLDVSLLGYVFCDFFFLLIFCQNDHVIYVHEMLLDTMLTMMTRFCRSRRKQTPRLQVLGQLSRVTDHVRVIQETTGATNELLKYRIEEAFTDIQRWASGRKFNRWCRVSAGKAKGHLRRKRALLCRSGDWGGSSKNTMKIRMKSKHEMGITAGGSNSKAREENQADAVCRMDGKEEKHEIGITALGANTTRILGVETTTGLGGFGSQGCSSVEFR